MATKTAAKAKPAAKTNRRGTAITPVVKDEKAQEFWHQGELDQIKSDTKVYTEQQMRDTKLVIGFGVALAYTTLGYVLQAFAG